MIPRFVVASTLTSLIVAACSVERGPQSDAELPDDGGRIEGDVGAGADATDAPGPEDLPDTGQIDAASDGAQPDAASSLSDSGDDSAASDASVDSGTSPPDASDDSGPPQDAGDDAGSSPDGGTAPLECSATCAAGQVACGGVCVSATDPTFGCGSCTRCYASSSNANILTATCSAGACAPLDCRAGFADCDGTPSNGCEADLGSTTSCGACGNSCAAGQVCENGTCKATCTFPSTNCSGACRDLTASSVACGSCTNKCAADNATASCGGGQCSATCVAGTTLCGGKCRNTTTDATACGAACTNCTLTTPPLGAASTCTAGACTFNCAADYAKCGGACVALESDAANCGSCGHACSASESCEAGACRATSSLRVVTGLSSPEDIAVDNQHIYVTDPGTNSVVQFDKTTFAQTVLATNQAKPRRIAVDQTHVYWTSNLGGAVLRTTIGGGSVDVVASAEQPTAIALAGTHVLFGAVDGSYLAPKGIGVTATKVANRAPNTTTESESYVSFQGNFYYLPQQTDTALWKIDPVAGTSTVSQVDTHRWWGLAAGPSTLWVWRWFGITGRVLAGLGTDGRPKPAGDSVTNPTSGLGSPFAVVGDGCSLYFTDGGTGIWRYTPEHAWAVRLTDRATMSRRLAVDDSYVYWIDASGFIGRIAK